MITILNEWTVYINVIVIAVVVILTVVGYMRGILRSIVSLLESVVSVYGGYLLTPVFASRFDLVPTAWFETIPLATIGVVYRAINLIGWFIVITAILRVLFLIIDILLRIFDHLPFVKATVKPLGALFGFVEGLFLVFAFAVILHTPFVANGSEALNKTILSPINDIAQKTEETISQKLIVENLLDDLSADFMKLTEEQRKFVEDLLDDCGLDSSGDIFSIMKQIKNNTKTTIESLINDGDLSLNDKDAVRDFLIKDTE